MITNKVKFNDLIQNRKIKRTICSCPHVPVFKYKATVKVVAVGGVVDLNIATQL